MITIRKIIRASSRPSWSGLLALRQGVCGAFAIALSIALIACADATPGNTPFASQPTVASVATANLVPQPTLAPKAPPPSTATAVAAPTPTAPAEAPTSIPTNAEVERLSAKGMELLTRFTEDYSPRESGSDAELAAAEFIKGYMEDLGYKVEFQSVEAEHIPWDAKFVSLIGDGMPDLRGVPLARTGMGDVTAPLVSVGKAFEDDIPEAGLQGSITLIERGEITFEEKVNRVADAGAAAAIIYNNERGGFRGALQSDGPIPAASLSQEQGKRVLGLLEDEPELQARVKIEPVPVNSQNVIAELPGRNADCGVVVLGAHYDSVANSQAAGDNGTGVVSLLIMAEELAKVRYEDEPLPYAVRFIFFGIEEIGLYGSRHYVDELNDERRENIIAMLNFDAMGKGDASVEGSSALADIASELAANDGIPLKRRAAEGSFGSDHAPFMRVGIPALFFYGDDFSIINSPDDTLEKVEPAIMGTNMAVGLSMLQEFDCKPES